MNTKTLQSVGDVMSPKVLFANTRHTFTQICRMFIELGIHHLPIVNDSGELAGMVSSNDVLKAYAHLLPGLPNTDEQTINSRITIFELMTPVPLFTVKVFASVEEASALMARNGVHALPVLDENEQVVGILTSDDIVRFCALNQEE